jgi:hypothetical protein
MKSLKLFALVALAAVAFAAQDPLLLRRELKEGSTEIYKVENQMKQLVDIPSMGEQDMIMTTVATCSVKTNKVDTEKGTAEIETLTKVDKADVDGSLAAMMGGQGGKLPDPKTEKGTLDSRNRVVITKDPKAKVGDNGGFSIPGMEMGTGAASAQSMLMFIELPEKPIKVGDSWDIAMPGGSAEGAAKAGIKDIKITVKLVGEKEVDGQTVYVLSTTGSFTLDIDTSKLPKQPGQEQAPMGNVKVKGTATMTGDGMIEKASGKTLSNVTNIKTDAKVFVEQLGQEIPVKGTVSMSLKLQK